MQNDETKWTLCYAQIAGNEAFIVFSSNQSSLTFPITHKTLTLLQKQNILEKESRPNKLGEYYPAR